MNHFKSVKGYFAVSNLENLLLITLIALVAADGVISNYLMAANLAVEANPFMRVWVSKDNFPLLKLAGGFLAAALLWLIHRRHPRIGFISTVICVIFYTAIILWNLLTFVVVAL